MICQRCYMVAELGRCPFCERLLCLECFDLDQEAGPCRVSLVTQRNDVIRELRGGGMSRKEVAERFDLSTMTISRVTRAVRRVMSG